MRAAAESASESPAAIVRGASVSPTTALPLGEEQLGVRPNVWRTVQHRLAQRVARIHLIKRSMRVVGCTE